MRIGFSGPTITYTNTSSVKALPSTITKNDFKEAVKTKEGYEGLKSKGFTQKEVIDTIKKIDSQTDVKSLTRVLNSFEGIECAQEDLRELGTAAKSLMKAPTKGSQQSQDMTPPSTPRGGSIALTPSVLGYSSGKVQAAGSIPLERQVTSPSTPRVLGSSSGKVQAAGSIPTTPRAKIASSITPDVASSEQKDFSWSHKFLQEGGLIKKAYKIVDQHEEGKICHEFALPRCTKYYVEPESLDDIRKWAEPGKTIAVCFAKGQVAHTAVMSGRDSFVQSLARKTESTTGNHGTIFETTFKTLTLMYPKVMIIKPGDNTDDAMWEKARSGTNLREPRTSDDLRTRLSLEAHGVEIH